MSANEILTMTPNGCLFYGRGIVFSNDYSSFFEWKGFDFNNATAAIMWAKARAFGNEEIAHKILGRQDVNYVKSLGEKIQNFDHDRWIALLPKILHGVLLAKFTQNEEGKKKLLGMGDRIFGEYSIEADLAFGTGFDHQADMGMILHPESWPGFNLVGKALNNVKTSIQNHPELVFKGK